MGDLRSSENVRDWFTGWLRWFWNPVRVLWAELWNKRSYHIRSGAFMISSYTLAYSLGMVANAPKADRFFYELMSGGALLTMWAIAFGANWLQAKFGQHSVGFGGPGTQPGGAGATGQYDDVPEWQEPRTDGWRERERYGEDQYAPGGNDDLPSDEELFGSNEGPRR